MYLKESNLKPVVDFLNSPAWQDLCRCLRQRKPPKADPTDSSETVAHKAFRRDGWDEVMEEIEKLPFERPPEEPKNPLARPALFPDD